MSWKEQDLRSPSKLQVSIWHHHLKWSWTERCKKLSKRVWFIYILKKNIFCTDHLRFDFFTISSCSHVMIFLIKIFCKDVLHYLYTLYIYIQLGKINPWSTTWCRQIIEEDLNKHNSNLKLEQNLETLNRKLIRWFTQIIL